MKRIVFLIVATAVLFAFVSCSAGDTAVTEAETAAQSPADTTEAAPQQTQAAGTASQPERGPRFDENSSDVDFTEVVGAATIEDIDAIYGKAADTQTEGDMLQYLYRNAVISFIENEDGEMIVCGIENYRPGSPFVIGGVKIAMDETAAKDALAQNGYELQGTSADGLQKYTKNDEENTLYYITVLFEDSIVSQLAGWWDKAAQAAYEQSG
jgi:hypothetical protein